ncbi:MAG TPA: 2'-5' RNA ligase family protein [Candidatus Acidoferrales bacterium]|nr:2'-5' RNA ligase family protein [Candidatus Acidoferrales bacterium]
MEDSGVYQNAFSIWLIPEPSISAMAREQIAILAGKLHSPTFEPHVTLVGGITGDKESSIAATQDIAKSIGNIEAEFDGISGLDEYFRAIFVRMKKTHVLQLANDVAKRRLGWETSPSYMPHMSLVYSDMEQNKKQELIGTIPEFSGVCKFVRLDLYSTAGKVEDWKRLAEFKL